MSPRTLTQDLRYALRAMRKQPLFTAVAVMTLALGIGANTAIFSVVHAVLLDRIPYPPDPGRVLYLGEIASQGYEMSVAYPSFKDWQQLNRSFETVAGFRDTELNLVGPEQPVRLQVRAVSHEYFELEGVSPLLGRLFVAEEDRPGAPRSLVLSYDLWSHRFGADAEIVGKPVRLDEESYSVIGVLPRSFELSAEERAYIALDPFSDNDSARERGNHQGLFALARLRPGVSFEAAKAEMESIAKKLEAEYPATNSGISVSVKLLSDERVEDYARTLETLMGAVSLVLLIACANVANLLLARGVSRSREAAIESALGAGRWRLAARSLTEAMLLAACGGAVGIGLAFAGLALLVGLLPADVPRLQHVGLSSQVLGYSFALSLVTAWLFGAVPALVNARARPSDALREGSRGTRGRTAAGRSLLVGEVAVATILLVGAGLLIRSVYELTRVEPGFEAGNLLTLKVGLPESRYERGRRQVFLEEVIARLSALPGVRTATVGLNLPMTGASWTSVFTVADQPVPPRAELPGALFTPVAPGYFETLAIPLREGRLLEAGDRADAPKVVVVNETLARRFWPGESAVGKRIKQGWPETVGEFNPWREIVGVVGDVKQYGLGEKSRMQTYIPIEQGPLWDVYLALRTESDPLALTEPATRAIHALDPDLPVFELKTMASVIDSSVAPRRFTMILLGLFAALALVLAAIGLYGVIAYSVARRTREIGIRMSVGAARRDIFGLVVREGLSVSSFGAAIGLVGAAAASRLLESSLYGVTPRDPFTFFLVPALLIGVALVACAVPALSACAVDPMRALRAD
jgi:putative ABC transport system permease protein